MHNFVCIALALVASCASFVEGSGQMIGFNVITSRAPDLQEFGNEVKRTLEAWSPSVSEILYSEHYREPGNVTLEFRETIEGIKAYTYPLRNKIIANAEFYRAGLEQNDNETTSYLESTLFHELVHVVQQYPPRGNCPGWFYEGLADLYTFYMFQSRLHNPKSTQNEISKPLFWAGQHFTQGYKSAAYFLNWLNAADPRDSTTAALQIHKACRAGTYTDNIFLTLFDKSKDQLWEQMIYSVPPGGFHVKLINVPDDLQGHAASLQTLMERLYSNFNETLHSPTYEELDVIYLEFDPSVVGGIAVNPKLKGIRVNDDYLRGAPRDAEVLVAMAHVMQQYKSPEIAPWLFSGIAYMTAYNAMQWTLRKPERPSHYTDGDLTTAWFLNSLNQRYRPFGKLLTYWLNRNLREGTYSENDFRRFTARTADQLWNQMMA